MTLSRGLLSNHYSLQYPSPCRYVKCLIYWQQLNPCGNDHPMTKLLTASVCCSAGHAEMTTPWQNCWLPQYAAWQTEIMQTWFACIMHCHESSINNFLLLYWNHDGWHLLHDKFQCLAFIYLSAPICTCMYMHLQSHLHATQFTFAIPLALQTNSPSDDQR